MDRISIVLVAQKYVNFEFLIVKQLCTFVLIYPYVYGPLYQIKLDIFSLLTLYFGILCCSLVIFSHVSSEFKSYSTFYFKSYSLKVIVHFTHKAFNNFLFLLPWDLLLFVKPCGNFLDNGFFDPLLSILYKHLIFNTRIKLGYIPSIRFLGPPPSPPSYQFCTWVWQKVS